MWKRFTIYMEKLFDSYSKCFLYIWKIKKYVNFQRILGVVLCEGLCLFLCRLL